MKKGTFAIVFLLVGFFLCAGNAFALPLNSNRPYADINTSDDPPGNLLQDIFDANITNGSLDAVADQSDFALWVPAEGAVDSYLITMVKADNGVLGIYSAATGAEYDFALTSNAVSFSINDSGALYIGGSLADSAFGQQFGFYWKNTSNPLVSYTEDDKNGTIGYGDDNNILALAYLLPESYSVHTMAFGGSTLTALGNNDWILAFEDVSKVNGGDGDFNDAVFVVEDMNPVPEPATMLLMGLGLLGLGAFGRKKIIK